MKRNILIILAFLPLFLSGQVNNVACTFNNTKGYLGSSAWYFNTLSVGKELILKASSISEDSLTYNSSGDLVTGSSGVTVDLDGSSEVIIGNSVRFGTPTSGTIYQVVDTGATAANLVLDQTFTGSITDEYYWGGVNTWYDESGGGNNAIQTTGIFQPKLLWVNADSVRLDFDGINDRLTILNQEMIDSNSSVSFYVYLNTRSTSRQNIFDNGAAGDADGYALEIFFTNKFQFRVDDGVRVSLLSANDVFINTDYKSTHILDRNISLISIYVNSEFSNSVSETADPITSNRNFYIGSSSFNDRYFNGVLYEFFIYNRALTTDENEILTQ